MAAYMTGVKMNNEVLSMTPIRWRRAEARSGNGSGDERPQTAPAVPTLLELAKAAGKAVGVVTTTEATHATPAATYAHICHRDVDNDIAAQAVPGGAGYNAALGSGLDVLLGGGCRHSYAPTRRRRPAHRRPQPDAELQPAATATSPDGTALKARIAAADEAGRPVHRPSHMTYELDRAATS